MQHQRKDDVVGENCLSRRRRSTHRNAQQLVSPWICCLIISLGVFKGRFRMGRKVPPAPSHLGGGGSTNFAPPRTGGEQSELLNAKKSPSLPPISQKTPTHTPPRSGRESQNFPEIQIICSKHPKIFARLRRALYYLPLQSHR